MPVRSALFGAILFATSVARTAPVIEAPASAQAGSEVEVTVTGSANPQDFVTIVPKASREGAYDAYQYVKKPGPLKLTVPTTPGEHEVRLLGAQSPYPTLARRPIRVEDIRATLEAPAQVAAGAKFSVQWKGPDNLRDYIGIGDADPKGRPYLTYEYTRKGSPLSLTAPDKPGEYEVRYFLGNGNKVIGGRRVIVGAVSASVSAAEKVTADTEFPVTWKGPDNRYDYITIVAKGAAEGTSGNYQYTSQGNPVKVRAPLTPGEYELRYSMGQSHATLARATLMVIPGKQEPGLVQVTASSALAPGSAVEIILDASGSMLQKIGKDRRIDIARQTLKKLTAETIPAGTPFALRVFGREENSCQSDLEIALSPLDPAAVGAKIAALQAKNGAKTPIGASLEKVASDLSAVKGERLIILLTDGEETCDGDPAAAIGKLKKAGLTVRVNIVGFAVDDPKLAVTFGHWADSGNGMYFDAKDAAGLNAALTQAMRPGFEILDGKGSVVSEGLAGGEALRVMPGNYTVRLKGRAEPAKPVVVQPKATASVRF